MTYEAKTLFLIPVVVLLLGTTAAFMGCDEQVSQSDSVLINYSEAKQILLFDNKSNAVYALSHAGSTVGYVVESEVVSRSGPFKIRVTLSSDYVVSEAKVTSYPAQRGRQVRFVSFTDQFKGKGPDDAIRLGRDIDAVSGATISSRVMTDGVKNAIRLAKRSST